MKRIRITYLIIFLLLLAVETLIALFVNDGFVRPYAGDMLVVILICAFLRVIFPCKPKLLPAFVTAFAVLVEVMQYFDFVSLLGLADNRIISIALGRTFDVKDIVCYAVGGVIFFAAEIIMKRRKCNEC